jgi:hypothetical protein
MILIGAGRSFMRSVDEYLDKAAQFRALAAGTSDPELKARYAELAEGYRALAKERERLVREGAITRRAKVGGLPTLD